MYLNEIYLLRNLAYGVEAAARTYFDKTSAELTLAEAAALPLPIHPSNSIRTPISKVPKSANGSPSCAWSKTVSLQWTMPTPPCKLTFEPQSQPCRPTFLHLRAPIARRTTRNRRRRQRRLRTNIARPRLQRLAEELARRHVSIWPITMSTMHRWWL